MVNFGHFDHFTIGFSYCKSSKNGQNDDFTVAFATVKWSKSTFCVSDTVKNGQNDDFTVAKATVKWSKSTFCLSDTVKISNFALYTAISKRLKSQILDFLDFFQNPTRSKILCFQHWDLYSSGEGFGSG
jgi:hypothetical protein